MLSKLLLRNIYKQDFIRLFKEFDVPGRTVRIRPIEGEDMYAPIQRIIKEENESGTYLSESQVDDFLFSQLFYAINNWHYVYENHDITENLVGKSFDEVSLFLEGIEGLKFNKSLLEPIEDYEYKVCTTRIEAIDDIVKRIHFLIKVGVTEDEDQSVFLFSGITIDVESNLVIIRFNQHLLDQYEEDPMDVLKTIKDLISGANQYGRAFETLNFNVIGLNEEKPKKVISELFKELSSEAEAILNQQVPGSTDDDIREFLEGKGLPCKEDYIQQIKSVIFQDIAQECAETLFTNGWVFRFVFREGQLTRASSRTDDKSPIYGSKVYWHLKELIFNSNEMQEAGYHWYLTNPTETDEPSFVQVRLESRLDTLIIHYYYKMRTHERKEKEDYVLRKISQYF